MGNFNETNKNQQKQQINEEVIKSNNTKHRNSIAYSSNNLKSKYSNNINQSINNNETNTNEDNFMISNRLKFETMDEYLNKNNAVENYQPISNPRQRYSSFAIPRENSFNTKSSVNDLMSKMNFVSKKLEYENTQNALNELKIEKNRSFNDSLSYDSKIPFEVDKRINDPCLNEIMSNRISRDSLHLKNHSIEFNTQTLDKEDTLSQISFDRKTSISDIFSKDYYNDDMSYFTASSSNNTCKRKRSVDLLRRDYIMSLIKNKIWVPGQNKKNIDFNTIAIFDWDDTLFCTSYLAPDGCIDDDMKITDEDYILIAKLEFAVLRLLTEALKKKADVYIITNSEDGWVNYSVNKFMPSVANILEKTKIISARSLYEKTYPGDSKKWKVEAYCSIKNNYSNVSSNIINMGDTLVDIEAGGILAKKFKESYLKSVKFRENPTIQELIKQLTLIANQFELVFKSVKNLTIRVEKK